MPDKDQLTKQEYQSLAELVARRIYNKVRKSRTQYTLGQLREDLARDLHEGFANWLLGASTEYDAWIIESLRYADLYDRIAEMLLFWSPPALVLGIFHLPKPSKPPVELRYHRLLTHVNASLTPGAVKANGKPYRRVSNYGNVARAFRKLAKPFIMNGDVASAREVVLLAHDFHKRHQANTFSDE